MKTKTRLYCCLLPVCCGLLLSSADVAWAQATPETPDKEDAKTHQAGFDIAISGGEFVHNGVKTKATLENVIDLLRERHPEVNIVVAPGVPRILIEDLKMRATDPRMELEALRIASGKKFRWGGGGSGDNALYIVETEPQNERDRLRVEAFSLGDYFATLPKVDDEEENQKRIAMKIRELKDMVDETVQIYRAIKEDAYGPEPSPTVGLDMRFHRGANLLILIGDSEKIEIAAKVIGALPQVRRSGAPMPYGAVNAYGGGRMGSGPALDPSPYGTPSKPVVPMGPTGR